MNENEKVYADESLLLYNFGFGLNEVLVQILCQQNFTVERCHLLVIVHQFLLIYLLNIAILIRYLFEFFFQIVVVDLLIGKFRLELFVVVIEAGQLKFVFLFYLVYLHTFEGLKIGFLTLEFVCQLSLGSACVDDCLLVFVELIFADLFEFTVIFQQSFDFFLQFLIIGHPLGLLSSFLLQFPLQLSLSILPLLLLLPIFLFYLFPGISFPFPLIFSFFSLIFPLILEIFQGFEVFLLENGVVFMKFSDLIVLEFIGGGQFGDLLIEESDVGLIFVAHCFFFVGYFGEGLLEIVDFAAVGLSTVTLSLFQLLNRPVSISNDSFEFLPTSFELLSVILQLSILILHKFLHFPPIILQCLHKFIIVVLHSFNIDGMQTGKSFLHIEEFFLIDSFPFIDLFLQQFDLVVQFFTLSGVFFERQTQLLLEVVDLFVFHVDDLAETVELQREFVVLMGHVLLEVADLVVVDLLEVVLDLLDFFVLFSHHFQEFLSVLLCKFLQSGDLVVLLAFDFFVALVDGVVSGAAFLELFAHSGDLELILLFCLCEVSLDVHELPLQLLTCFVLFFSRCQPGLFLSFQSLFFPSLNILQQTDLLIVALIALAPLFPEQQAHLFILGPQLEQLLIFSDGFFLQG